MYQRAPLTRHWHTDSRLKERRLTATQADTLASIARLKQPYSAAALSATSPISLALLDLCEAAVAQQRAMYADIAPGDAPHNASLSFVGSLSRTNSIQGWSSRDGGTPPRSPGDALPESATSTPGRRGGLKAETDDRARDPTSPARHPGTRVRFSDHADSGRSPRVAGAGADGEGAYSGGPGGGLSGRVSPVMSSPAGEARRGDSALSLGDRGGDLLDAALERLTQTRLEALIRDAVAQATEATLSRVQERAAAASPGGSHSAGGASLGDDLSHQRSARSDVSDGLASSRADISLASAAGASHRDASAGRSAEPVEGGGEGGGGGEGVREGTAAAGRKDSADGRATDGQSSVTGVRRDSRTAERVGLRGEGGSASTGPPKEVRRTSFSLVSAAVSGAASGGGAGEETGQEATSKRGGGSGGERDEGEEREGDSAEDPRPMHEVATMEVDAALVSGADGA